LVAAILVALVVGLGVGWLLPRSEPASVGDHRAYPADSGEITLAEGLRRAEIALPGCVEDEDLRYAWINEGYSYYQDGYLMFRTSEECMNTFLSANRMVARVTQATRLAGPEAEGPPRYSESWLNDTFAELGWEVGPEQSFQQFGVTTGGSYAMTAFVRRLPGSSDVRAYVYAYRAG
jgi:hypothetical protein